MLKRTMKPYWLVAATFLLLLAAFDSASAGVFRTLYSFGGEGAGRNPVGALLVDNSGNIYGTTPYPGGGTAYKLSPRTGATVLARFRGVHGKWPVAGVIADTDGNLYGTTEDGGVPSQFCKHGCGTVFRITPDGTETVLYSFKGNDGAGPYVGNGLVMDDLGNLYGNTRSGGVGAGTVFKLTPSGVETVLHSFQGGDDGVYPVGSPIMDADGNLYGTTESGGASDQGIVFKISPDGTETILHSFAGVDGYLPYSGLTMDSQGNLFGTTFLGGAYSRGNVFKLSPDGKETQLYEFRGGSDGANPESGLVLDDSGNLYGVANGGSGTGCNNSGCGVVFKVSPNGKERVLHTFQGALPNGWYPNSPLTLYKGNLYGTTDTGGANYAGTVFRLKP